MFERNCYQISLHFMIIVSLHANFLYFFIFTSPSETDLQVHALAVAECVRKNVSNKHLKRKDSLFETLVGYFNREPHLQRLADDYSDPQDSSNLVTGSKVQTKIRHSQQSFDQFYEISQNDQNSCWNEE